MSNILSHLLNHFLKEYYQLNQSGDSQKQLKNDLSQLFKHNHLDNQLNRFEDVFKDLFLEKKTNPVKINFNQALEFKPYLSEAEKKRIEQLVTYLKPWHKGIYKLDNIKIDGHWDCSIKWQRLEKTLQNFIKNKNELKVLDVGSGNGYFLWRLKKLIADNFKNSDNSLILGIDRHLLYLAQFYLFFSLSESFSTSHSPCFLPLTDCEFIKIFKEIKAGVNQFDIVLSMGLLYHQKDPLAHLLRMKQCLKNSNSIFILETLITNDTTNKVAELICPKNEYCKMKNVWFVPNLTMLKLWLNRLKFNNVAVIDISRTTNLEQRSTELSQNWSAEDAVNLTSNKTVEGYGAPLRAMLKISI